MIKIKPKRKVIRSKADAFTIIELLLGALIAALIGLTVYNVFWAGMALDAKLRWIQESYTEALIADRVLTRDLENAITIDLSGNYPDQKSFDGKKNELAFLTVSRQGIKRVRYFAGLVDWGKATKTLIGRKTGHMTRMTSARADLPIEFLLREEMSMADWLNGVSPKVPAQIIAGGIKKGSFVCQYVPREKNIDPMRFVYKDRWDLGSLPLAVRCLFSLYDPKNPKQGIIIQRDIFLAPIKRNDHETDFQTQP